MDDDHLKRWARQHADLHRTVQNLHPLAGIPGDRERLAQLVDPSREAIRELARASSGIDQAVAASGIEDLAARAVAVSTAMPKLAEWARQYEFPNSDMLSTIHDSLHQPGVAQVIRRYQLQEDSIRQAMSAMRSPWLDLQDQIRSISALTELQGIGHVVTSLPTFSPEIAGALRTDLGDWRGPLAIDPSSLIDPSSRHEFYIARGLDTHLTAFPNPAFRDGLVSAGLYDGEHETEDNTGEDGTEAAFMRTNEAHDRLMRFEFHLRRFIDNAMTAAVGEDWVQRRVPPELREKWEAKQARGRAEGDLDQPLIAYADFTDYVTIIIKRDNWRDVFGELFEHKPSIEESFRRLYPVRIATMHARLITNDDALFLLVEIKRLSLAMGLNPQTGRQS